MATVAREAWVLRVLCLGMIIAAGFIGDGEVIAQTAPPAGRAQVLAADALGSLKLEGSQKQLATVQKVSVNGQSFDHALRVSVAPGATAEWNVQLATMVDKPVRGGDVMLAHFWMRCGESMTGDGFVGFVFELAKADFEKSAEKRVVAGSAWRECFVPFVAKRDYAAGAVHVCLRLGYDRQTIEIGGLEIINYGKDVALNDLPRTKITYAGRAADAPWRMEALARIEQIRKGDLRVKVTDASGKPITGATVNAKLKRHEFGFGTCVTVEHLLKQTPDAQKYREFVETYCNRAVFENDMKWPAMYESIPPQLDQALDWLLERDIQVRGHNLHWPSWKWAPRPLQQYKDNPEELRRRAAERVTSAVSHFKGKLSQWDVVNEPYSEHDLLDILGPDVMVDWFKLARAADPQCKLYLNDFGILDGGAGNQHRKHFSDTIQRLRDKGAPIDGIGIQSHFGSDLPSPSQMLAVLDQFAKFDLPIESTEVSLNIEERDVQADYLRDYMIAFFSHPKVEGIMLWGFWEGRHWRPQAALFAKNWTPRPIAQVWMDLLGKEWKTDASATANSQGVASIRGFLGDYEITVKHNGKSKVAKAKLSKGGTEMAVVVD